MAVTGYTKLGALSKIIAAPDQGQYFVGTNATPGTGIASGAITSLADTTPTVLFQNGNTVKSGVNVYLDALWLEFTAIGSGYTSHRMSFKIDTSQTTARYTSGGTAITPVSPSGTPLTSSNAKMYFGAITAAAAGAAVLVESHILRTVIAVAGDQHYFDFGAGQGQAMSNLPSDGTLQVAKYYACTPVVLAPQQWFAAHLWGASMGGGGITCEFSLRWLEC